MRGWCWRWTSRLASGGGRANVAKGRGARGEGAEVWSLNLYESYQVGQRPDVGRNTRRDYGYTTSPRVHGEWVIVEVGDDEGTLMALDKTTGERRWASQCRDEAGHTGG